jgi:hypothetical protein
MKKKRLSTSPEWGTEKHLVHFSFTLSEKDSVELKRLIKKANRTRCQYLRFIVQSWIQEQLWLNSYNQ